jgi:threonine/homoserine/homoserine lactone efflux protein
VSSSPDLWIFFAMVFGIVVIPGMDMAFVASCALVAGRSGGLAAVAGMMAGGVVHVTVGAIGIAAVLQAWPAAFNAMLVAGSLYMARVGWAILRSGAAAPAAAGPARVLAPPKPLDMFRRALATCLLNPKAYAFTLAVLPAFLRSDERSTLAQIVWLCVICAGTQLLVYGSVALVVSGAGARVAGGERGRRTTACMIGPLLMAGAALTPMLAWQPT